MLVNFIVFQTGWFARVLGAVGSPLASTRERDWVGCRSLIRWRV